MDNSSLLRAKDVVVQFGGLRALDAATVDVAVGSVTGLIGPNGAGKTTLFNAITGFVAPTSGSLSVTTPSGTTDFTNVALARRVRLGISRTFQRLELCPSMTVLDNVLVGIEARKRWRRNASGGSASLGDASRRDSSRGSENLALELLDRVGAADLANTAAGALPTGTARLVELARALASDPTFLLLDEPSSGLDAAESTQLATLLNELCTEGRGVLLVEHDMALVMSLCTRVYVLNQGRVIASGSPAEVQSDEAVQLAYLGSVGST